MKYLVLSAGVVRINTAYFFTKDKHEVTGTVSTNEAVATENIRAPIIHGLIS